MDMDISQRLSNKLLSYNGRQKQLGIIVGEFGELITAMSDYFYRDKKINVEDIIDEIIDAYFQLKQLRTILTEEYKDNFDFDNYLFKLFEKKEHRLMNAGKKELK